MKPLRDRCSRRRVQVARGPAIQQRFLAPCVRAQEVDELARQLQPDQVQIDTDTKFAEQLADARVLHGDCPDAAREFCAPTPLCVQNLRAEPAARSSPFSLPEVRLHARRLPQTEQCGALVA